MKCFKDLKIGDYIFYYDKYVIRKRRIIDIYVDKDERSFKGNKYKIFLKFEKNGIIILNDYVLNQSRGYLTYSTEYFTDYDELKKNIENRIKNSQEKYKKYKEKADKAKENLDKHKKALENFENTLND